MDMKYIQVVLMIAVVQILFMSKAAVISANEDTYIKSPLMARIDKERHYARRLADHNNKSPVMQLRDAGKRLDIICIVKHHLPIPFSS